MLKLVIAYLQRLEHCLKDADLYIFMGESENEG